MNDENMIPQFIDKLQQLDRYATDVGVFAEEEDSFYAMIAAVHEFGVAITVTPKMRAYLHSQGLHLKETTKVIIIPERSFLRTGLDKFKAISDRVIARAINDLFQGTLSPIGVYERIGIAAESMVKKAMLEVKEPPLHPFTISRRRKQSTKPLIDTGGLFQRIMSMTVERGGD